MTLSDNIWRDDYGEETILKDNVKDSVRELLLEFDGQSVINEPFVNNKIREIFGDALCVEDVA